MLITDIPAIIARELTIKPHQVTATINLLDDSNTVPFIARYRKEATGELNEEHIRTIEERTQYLRNLIKRQEEILASIESQDKLTPELTQAIQSATKLQELEDLYLPYRPKKRTRAQIAREKGLEPLATLILAQQQTTGNVLDIAAEYINEEHEITTAELALSGAQDIIAETVSERADIRSLLRKELWQKAQIATQLIVEETEAKEFLTYKDYREPINRMPSHRILAVNRGETKGTLKVALATDQEANIQLIGNKVLSGNSIFSQVITDALTDGYKRLLFPTLERELRTLLTENAEKQAIRVFGLNLRPLLLQAPLAGHTVMGLDPGYRTGCKLAVVSPTGAVLATSTLYLTMSEHQRQEAAAKVLDLIHTHGVTLISIGNGTASYETEEFAANLISTHNLNVHYIIANEAGASVYSASKLAKEELPDLDVTIRGAVSIARRIQDPLAELVKIDPKSIGVGQYQHDVNQKELGGTLTNVVESCVNHVGVELNTASPALLTYVAGINASVAKNIVAYRTENGQFKSRKELLKVARLGKAAFTQCAGFLRIAQAGNPLDNTPVHPESYELAAAILSKLGFTLQDLSDKNRLAALQQAAPDADAACLAAELNAGEPTVRDILAALAKPGRDPREDVPPPQTRKNIVKLSDITPGTLIKGTVHNVTDFGVFVDIGIKINGLIHRSELSHKFFRHPTEVVSVGDIIDVVVINVDEERKRIGLSLKQVPKK
ncbi:30S ribosomal protein S1 [Sporomusa ovata DSM 2662]|uniref:Transcription accessory protein (S1 RNA-binding domain) n=1 Tax=Sporomusa ovata TaxID=2378 RepID=A0A0U1KUI7_9FIRM|nr:Tex family protein [Sporomusa ovata]EQB26972.1 RNA binding S1 domain containing protein [Sporomusa ovata DSM 2662]CQR71077.1 Transcription accessory protein (S1 RNA-binding domain) [Sporomusa ovata]